MAISCNISSTSCVFLCCVDDDVAAAAAPLVLWYGLERRLPDSSGMDESISIPSASIVGVNSDDIVDVSPMASPTVESSCLVDDTASTFRPIT